jgi:hypothetical protein
MVNILLGAEGSGIEQRKESHVAVSAVSDEDIKDDAVANIATQYSRGNALFYLNSLIGLRRAEIDLFFTIKDNFGAVCAVIDRAESVTAEDRKIIEDDICSKLGLGSENIYFIKKSDQVGDLVKIGLKFKKSADITPAAAVVSAVKLNAAAEAAAKNECGAADIAGGEENDDDGIEEVFLPAMAAMGIFITVLSALYYIAESFSGGGPNGRGRKSVFGFIYSALKYLAVFLGTVALMFMVKKYSDKK